MLAAPDPRPAWQRHEARRLANEATASPLDRNAPKVGWCWANRISLSAIRARQSAPGSPGAGLSQRAPMVTGGQNRQLHVATNAEKPRSRPDQNGYTSGCDRLADHVM